MNKIRTVVADTMVLGGIASTGYGLYTLFGVGVTCLVVGAAVVVIGVALNRSES